MIRYLVICAALLLATALHAQEDDRSRLVRMIENALSDGNARQVRIEGFEGSLSSTATLDLLSISDAEGVWITIENAELTWRPSALLRGSLEVERLAADELTLARLPLGEPDPAAPEATPFSLPDLPVSVALDNLAIERINLGAPLLGFPVTASLAGTAGLADGAGQAELTLQRLDGPTGRFGFVVGYANETGVLDLDLSLVEDPGGLTVTLLGLPGAPSVDLGLSGSGPLDDITLDLTLATDGVSRVSGQLTSARAEDGVQRISTAITGDLAQLVLPEYQAFFGPETTLDANLHLPVDGGLVLDHLTLDSQSISLEGTLALAADNTPLAFDLTGRIAGQAGGDVRLPVSGTNVTLSTLDLSLTYNRAAGNAWDGDLTIADLQAGPLGAARSQMTLAGQITPPDLGPFAVSVDLLANIDGLLHSDSALQRAMGEAATLATRISWQEGEPLRLSQIAVNGETASVRGDASFETGQNRLQADLDFSGAIPDISAFSDLARQSLAGGVDMRLQAQGDLLSGAFGTTVNLTAQDLQLGTDLPPQLTAGDTRIELRLHRDAGGLRLDLFDLASAGLTASAEGLLSSGPSALTVEARLADIGLLTSALSGPVEADIALERDNQANPWSLASTLSAAGGISTEVSGFVGLPDGTVDLDLSGSLPLAAADRFIAPNSLRGEALFDLAVVGAPGLEAISGRISTRGARLSLPSLGLVLEGLAAATQISGGTLGFNASARFPEGGQLSIDGGQLDLRTPGLPGRLDATLTNVVVTEQDLFRTRIDSAMITLSGPFAAGPSVTGQVLLGQTDVVLDDLGPGAAEPIPEISHIGASSAQYATRLRAGLVQSGGGASGPPVALDLIIRAPGRIFIRGSGLDAELGGTIRLGGTSNALIPSGQFDLIRGRLSFLGRRFDIAEATATLQGSFDPALRIVARTQTSNITALITIEGPASAPELTISSIPELPQDEILAQLFFGRSASGLSAVQALQLVDAVSGFAGGGSIIGNLRSTLGVDDLDLSTDADGQANLRLGRYVTENLYTDVEIQGSGDTSVNLNLDLTPNITLRGGVSSDGSSGIGLFFEQDY